MADVKLFVDFWNFQLAWNDHIKPAEDSEQSHVRINWKALPEILIAGLPTVLGPSSAMTYKGTQVYASVDASADSKDVGLRKFLHNALGQMTGYRVSVTERRPKQDKCPHCARAIHKKVEKGVDASIVTDLFAGAINDAYDVAVLVSNDSDFVPAISTIQDRLNKQVVHVGFRKGGDYLRTAAWAHIVLDGEIAAQLTE